ncbi:MAG: 3-deoxy-7-phosphoheptulonate synthase [Opitutae bacterium]|nr:3-deoxy-7-phosphoheptulonate synthase [Opitutae bacterium]
MQQTSDIRITQNKTLPAPEILRQEIAKTPKQAEFVLESRKQIASSLNGKDDRLLVIVGPCSIHDTQAGIEYAKNLAGLSHEIEDRILVAMRVYFEKPRTTVGWKGLIMDPDLNNTCNLEKGLRTARSFLRDILDLRLPTATELLDPITPQYISDLLSWTAIGARTTESQTHRQMASGLSMPVGFKNATSGNVNAAINAILASSQEQTFLGIDRNGKASAVTTTGNPECHLILRGGDNGANYDELSVRKAQDAIEAAGIDTSIMIDCSHANSQKDPAKQPEVLTEIIRQFKDPDLRVSSAMIESNLLHGSQKFPPTNETKLQYGLSITDGCVDWKTTETILRKAHQDLS